MNEFINASAGGIALGRQITVEFYDCSSAILADADKLEQVFLTAARKSGATIVNSTFHRFKPQGVSGVVVISESHFAVHAWPEHDYAAVDIFTCGGNVDFDVAVKEIAKGVSSENYLISSMVNRGILGEAGLERLVASPEGINCHGFQLSWKKRFEQTNAHAISASIDIYHCGFIGLAESAKMQEIAEKLITSLDCEVADNWSFSTDPSGIKFSQTLRNGCLNGFVDLSNQTVYVDIFVNDFFDPRCAAELLIQLLSGKYYRMQPHVRQ